MQDDVHDVLANMFPVCDCVGVHGTPDPDCLDCGGIGVVDNAEYMNQDEFNELFSE